MEKSTKPFALVVDDDPFILLDTHDILENAGFRVHEAADGDEAKEVLDAHGEEIILLFSDVEMPGDTDGFALARYAAEHWPEVEIVIASERVTPGAGEMPEKATFISKPFNARMVHGHLRETLPDGKMPEPLKQAV